MQVRHISRTAESVLRLNPSNLFDGLRRVLRRYHPGNIHGKECVMFFMIDLIPDGILDSALRLPR